MRGRFTSGVVLLAVCNLLIKVSGLLFKVPMNYIVGDTGMGYYGAAYSVYTFLYMLSTAGLPVAVAMMVAEARSVGRFLQVKKVFRTALLVFLLLGIAGSGVMLLFASPLSRLIGSEGTVYCITAIAPTLFFICIASAYRGYFQGEGQMAPLAVSGLLEALGKLILGIGAALWSIRRGYPIHITAACAVTGVTVGSLLGMAYLILRKGLRRDALPEDVTPTPETTPISAILRRFLAVSLPITVTSSVMSLSGMIDTVMIQRILQASGLSGEEAVALYGNYTSLAVPMFNLPPVLIYPITCALIPILTSARASGDRKKASGVITTSLRGAVLTGIPCAFGMAALAHPILRLFYHPSSAGEAAPLLTLLAPASLFVCILAVTNAVLQASGREGLPVISMLAGAVVKSVSGVILVGQFGMSGAPISTFLCYFTAAAMNFVFVLRTTGVNIDWGRTFMKPLLGGGACALTAYVGYVKISALLSPTVSTLAAILLGGGVYIGVILFTGTVTAEELALLAGERRLGRLFAKFNKGRKQNHEHKRKTRQRRKA